MFLVYSCCSLSSEKLESSDVNNSFSSCANVKIPPPPFLQSSNWPSQVLEKHPCHLKKQRQVDTKIIHKFIYLYSLFLSPCCEIFHVALHAHFGGPQTITGPDGRKPRERIVSDLDCTLGPTPDEVVDSFAFSPTTSQGTRVLPSWRLMLAS